jgi:hypothetical protein
VGRSRTERISEREGEAREASTEEEEKEDMLEE